MSLCDKNTTSTSCARWLGVLLLTLSTGAGIAAVVVARSITLENPESERVYAVFGLLAGAFLTAFFGSWAITEAVVRFVLVKKIKYSPDFHIQIEREVMDLVAAFSLAVTVFWVAIIIMVQSKTLNYWVSAFILVVIFFCCLLIFNDHTFFFRAIWRAMPSLIAIIKRLAKITTKEDEEAKKKLLSTKVKKREPQLTYNPKLLLEEAEDEFYEY
jgi:hypothetical protein